ncbi:DinB family protein [Propioniciclava soli]|uniref:DinB family protein n=1 Tax=Propioniciclava soli TaxID=2775081 RepID=A0ABZ3C695_9ACTN|nr:DinB family protein [Propioniciclava soli]
MASIDLTHELVEQIDWHWRGQLRSRLDGLTDDEYLWEPVAGAWNVRPKAESTMEMQPGAGDWTIDWAWPEPDPAPVTTIAWRLNHLLVGVLGARLAGHFGGEPCDYDSYDYPSTAADALARLDDLYARWRDGIASWSDADLAVPVGDAEPPQYAESPRITLVLHINRELIHHGAEIALLRDLYAHSA